MLWLATEEQRPELESLLAAEPLLNRIDATRAHAYCPVLRPEWTAVVAVEEGAQDLDVAGFASGTGAWLSTVV